jgi:Asp-tRNA(Asn)/Glu-tRNA(Gln) amidotransferase A subunit family amidase
MPLGLQLLAPEGGDAQLLAVAQRLEGALDAGRPVPDLTSFGL